jgi:hypothetical protein
MVQLNAFLQMEKKKVSSQMELSKGLRRVESKRLSMLVDKKIFSSQMALELESILMAESRKPIRMALLRPP